MHIVATKCCSGGVEDLNLCEHCLSDRRALMDKIKNHTNKKRANYNINTRLSIAGRTTSLQKRWGQYH